MGPGYVPVKNIRIPIYLLAWFQLIQYFSPVKKVNYYVENTRLGHSPIMRNCILRCGPMEDKTRWFCCQAAQILKAHYPIFINFEEQEEDIEEEVKTKKTWI